MPVTHQQIAEELGISRALVTRALHRTRASRVSAETQREVLQAAERLGYVPRNLTTHTVGCVMHLGGLQTREDISFLLHLEQELRKHNLRLSLISADALAVQPLSEILNAKTVDGAVLMVWDGGKMRPHWSPGMPFLVATEEPVPDDVEQIAVDLKGTFVNVFRYLQGLGHERVGLVTGQATDSGFRKRLGVAARGAATEVGLTGKKLKIISAIPGKSAAATLAALNEADPPTAIVIGDSFRAFPVYCGLLAAGYSIPSDLTVIALFDDPEYLSLNPPLAATTAGGIDVAAEAVQRLLLKIREPETTARHSLLPGEIIERESAGLAPAPRKDKAKPQTNRKSNQP